MADLLVIGGGMAGLAAGAAAAEAGARVTVVEKSRNPGGSAGMSAGIVWTAPDYETLRRVVPGGDPALGQALIDGFWPAVEWVRASGVSVSEPWEGQMGFGSADRTGRVSGAVIEGQREIHADAVVLATGGFQGDPELLATFIGPGADAMLVRSNTGSVGDGFRLGRDVGASASKCLDGFYGHLVPSPLAELREDQFLSLTQYYSNHCILVNRLGLRFTDESLGDEVSNQATLRQPGSRAVLLCDERIRAAFAVTAPYPHGQVIDRIAAAREAGGRYASARRKDKLVDAVASWGVTRRTLAATIDQWTAASAGDDDALDVARAARPEPFVDPPFHALELQPAITFPFGGLRVDADGRVLDRDGTPVPGLFAAGADAGGLQDVRYVGGLALGLVFGPRAARTAIAELSGARGEVRTS